MSAEFVVLMSASVALRIIRGWSKNEDLGYDVDSSRCIGNRVVNRHVRLSIGCRDSPQASEGDPILREEVHS